MPEVLLIPLTIRDAEPIGTLWLVAADTGYFTKEHSRVMAELAAFAGMALRMIQSEQRLHLALQQQETLTREMSHRIKNLFAIVNSIVRMTARTATTKEELAENLSGRLYALSQANGLIRRSFGDDVAGVAKLRDLLTRVLRPHERAPSLLKVPCSQ